MVHGLVTHHSTQARLRAIRGTDAASTAAGSADVVAIGRVSSPWKVRDGVQRALVCGVLDAQNRLSITKLAPALGWPDDIAVATTVEAGRVYVRLGVADSPHETDSRYVAGRLTLPACALECQPDKVT